MSDPPFWEKTDASTVPTTHYHFGYGSNLWLEQMHQRCPSATYVGRGVLKGYKWIINQRGYANLVQVGTRTGPEHDTYGVVYTLTDSDMRTLDRKEGVPHSYQKYTVKIRMYQADPPTPVELSCLVYIDPIKKEGQPKNEYVSRINRGLADAKLPNSWVKEVIRKFIPEEGEDLKAMPKV